MIIIYTLPDQQEELDQQMVTLQRPYHVWHDVPNNIVYIYTGEDLEPVENIQ